MKKKKKRILYLLHGFKKNVHFVIESKCSFFQSVFNLCFKIHVFRISMSPQSVQKLFATLRMKELKKSWTFFFSPLRSYGRHWKKKNFSFKKAS